MENPNVSTHGTVYSILDSACVSYNVTCVLVFILWVLLLLLPSSFLFFSFFFTGASRVYTNYDFVYWTPLLNYDQLTAF